MTGPSKNELGQPLGQGMNLGVFLRGEDSENPHPPMKCGSSFGRTSNRRVGGRSWNSEFMSQMHWPAQSEIQNRAREIRRTDLANTSRVGP
jgi:hypothetical protein